MIRRRIVGPGLIALFAASTALGQGARPFVVPRDRAAWDARRESLRRDLETATSRDLPPRPALPRIVVDTNRTMIGPPNRFQVASPWRDALIELDPKLFSFDPADPAIGQVEGRLTVPRGADLTHRVPLIVLVTGLPPQGQGPGPEGDWVGCCSALHHLGFATLSFPMAPPSPSGLRLMRVGLDAALARPEFDPGRVGVIGLGRGAPNALRLMALDERIGCGVVGLGPGQLGAASDRFEDFAALCAPRPLSLQVVEPWPIADRAPGRLVERAVKPTYKVYGTAGTGLAMNIFGKYPGFDSGIGELQWLAGLEQLDKHFCPQQAEPLGHEPESEPELDARALHLTEHGLAGWSAEMSQRPGTWSWSDGVIWCRPGPGEFGWLRAPVEVGDFLLRVEWRVPPKGNGGIFLRARPVTWTLPTADRPKPLQQALGLEWPSRTGLELQAQADPGEVNRYSSGSLYRHAAPAANPTNPPGQWNRYTVRARGLRVEVWSNGRQILDTTLDRYPATLPRPPLRGYIGLQNHGSPGEYRNVRLQILEPSVQRAEAAPTGSPGAIP